MEKLQEFIVDELGYVTIAVRPMLPFPAEGCRLGVSSIELFGDGRKVTFDIPDDVAGALQESEEILLCEFSMDGSRPDRELVLLVDQSAA